MPGSEETSGDVGVGGLGEELRRLRALRRLTLRDVQKRTGISSPYLSQLETGKIAQPSPHFLYKLAELYQVSYESLLERAGYLVRKKQEPETAHLSGAALATFGDLTPEEEVALASFLAFLRSQKQESPK